jgi:hypothetical protein
MRDRSLIFKNDACVSQERETGVKQTISHFTKGTGSQQLHMAIHSLTFPAHKH